MRAFWLALPLLTACASGHQVCEPTQQAATMTTHRTRTAADSVETPAAPVTAVETEQGHDPLGRQWGQGLVMTGNTPHRLLLFTFDDGPDERHTPRLLDQLDELGIRAVFFLVARQLWGRHPRRVRLARIAREIVRRGHFVASHTWTHPNLTRATDAEVIDQVERAQATFEDTFGGRPWLIRPPGGAHDLRVDQLTAWRGYTTVLWTIGMYDTRMRRAWQVVDEFHDVMRGLERRGIRGGIVMLHDTHAHSVNAFPLIVADIREKNCDLLAAGEELYDIVDDPSLFWAPQGDAIAGTEVPPVVLAPEVLEARQARVRAAARERCEPDR